MLGTDCRGAKTEAGRLVKRLLQIWVSDDAGSDQTRVVAVEVDR